MPHLVSAFKGERGSADVYVAFGVPVAERPAAGPLALALRTGVFVLDESGRAVAEARSSPASLPRAQIHALPQATLYVEAPVLAVPPGAYALVAEFDAAGGRVAGYDREPLAVPDFARDGLRLSDLLLAYHVEEAEGGASPGAVRRRGYEIVPAPWAVFGRSQPLYLYVEAYGLETDAGGEARYEVEAALVPADERGGLRRLWDRARGEQLAEGVSVAFEAGGRGRDQGRYFVLDVADQRAGAYVLALRVQQGERAAETMREVVLE
jgi:hypothetical protein